MNYSKNLLARENAAPFAGVVSPRFLYNSSVFVLYHNGQPTLLFALGVVLRARARAKSATYLYSFVHSARAIALASLVASDYYR